MNKYKKCVDIDECKLGMNDCGFGSICLNTPGSYQCKCPEGMKGKYCHEDINECDDKQEWIQIHKKLLKNEPKITFFHWKWQFSSEKVPKTIFSEFFSSKSLFYTQKHIFL